MSLFQNLKGPSPHTRSIISLIFFIFVFGFLSSCSTTQPQPAAELTPLPRTEIENTLEFEQETLYALIAAEIGLIRDRYELGLNNYVQQARATQDVNITARAAQVARILKRHPESLEMAELWHKLDPGSREARYILVAEYVFAERFTDALTEANALLKSGHPAGFDDIAIDAVEKKYKDLSGLSQQYETKLARYPDNVELLIGQSVLRHALGELEPSLEHANRAVKLDQQSARAHYQRFRILNSMDRKVEATAAYAKLVELQPENTRARSSYAQMLLQQDLDAALQQYQLLHEQSPYDSDILLNLALVQLELEFFEDAQNNLMELISRDTHNDLAHYGLGEIARAKELYKEALSHYLSVSSGVRYVQASSKAANITKALEGLDAARNLFRQRRNAANAADRESLFLIEVNALSSNGEIKDAIALLNTALENFPDSIKLRYARAMQFASIRKPLLAEQDFKYVLKQMPNNPATLNALGYTLLDQTDRTEEAGTYIRKALELESEDAAILDSMGWYEFKRGNTRVALDYLQRAFEQYVDDEIAAHLGEVLWTLGKKSKAKQVWKQGFTEDPNSPVIKKTLERLGVEWQE